MSRSRRVPRAIRAEGKMSSARSRSRKRARRSWPPDSAARSPRWCARPAPRRNSPGRVCCCAPTAPPRHRRRRRHRIRGARGAGKGPPNRAVPAPRARPGLRSRHVLRGPHGSLRGTPRGHAAADSVRRRARGRATAALARGAGFEVTVVDEREELATPEQRFPGCAPGHRSRQLGEAPARRSVTGC